MNSVNFVSFDKRQNLGALEVNRYVVSLGLVDSDNWDEKNFRYHRVFQVTMAYDFNQSNPITFQAKTIKGLMGKLRREKNTLVKF